MGLSISRVLGRERTTAIWVAAWLIAWPLASGAGAWGAPPVLLPPIPGACISSPFGPRVLPGRPLAGTYHWGFDLAAPAGSAVRAAAAGRVVVLHRRGPGGLQVALRHDGFATLYAHLGRVAPALAEGQAQVAAGAVLGVVGRTGLSYGAHVYFELQRDGVRVDPAPYLGLAPCGAAH